MKNLTGATLTKRAREHSLKHLAQTLRRVGMAAQLQHITARHIERYVQIRQAASVSDRTLQNRLSHIRSELRTIGRGKLADSDRLGCAHLGVDGASRAGTHAALTTEHYEHVLELARALHPGFAACLQLQRTLGLRQREAIQAGDSLKSWTSTLEHKGYVHVTKGTRGGKTRDATPIAVDSALAAGHSAIEAAAENGGDLIPSTSLQGAVRAYGRLCAAVGMTGEHASDALLAATMHKTALQITCAQAATDVRQWYLRAWTWAAAIVDKPTCPRSICGIRVEHEAVYARW